MLKRFAIFVHRWLGVALCLVFLLWFPSGIAMMYWGYPDVSAADRLERAPALDPIDDSALAGRGIREARIQMQPPPGQVRLNTYDGRPAYRFRADRSNAIVFADTGEERGDVSMRPGRKDCRRVDVAAGKHRDRHRGHRGRSVDAAKRTIGNLQPLGSTRGRTASTSMSRRHPARSCSTRRQRPGSARMQDRSRTGSTSHRSESTDAQWSRVVISSSGIGTFRRDSRSRCRRLDVLALEALSLRRRADGDPLSRTKALAHGARARLRHRDRHVGVQRHAVDGTVPAARPARATAPHEEVAATHSAVAPRAAWTFAAFSSKAPARGADRSSETSRSRNWSSRHWPDEPVYMATIGGGDTRIVPSTDEPIREFDHAAHHRLHQEGRGTRRDCRRSSVLDQYDRVLLDRRRERPLPVIVAHVERQPSTRAATSIPKRHASSAAIATATGSRDGSTTDSTRSTSPGSTTTAPPGTSSSLRSCSAARGCASRRSCSHGECLVESWREGAARQATS